MSNDTRWILATALAGLACGAAAELTTTGSVVQSIAEVELRDTVLDEGEVVQVTDEAVRGVSLRIGDGGTAGGNRVTDPGTLLVPSSSALRRDQYTLLYEGNATYSGGRYSLITPTNVVVTANTGAVVVVSSYPISGVTYTEYATGSTVTLSPTSFETAVYTARVSGADIGFSAPGGLSYAAWVSNLTVSAWDEAVLLGITNDARYTTLLVTDSPGDDEPVSSAYLESRGSNHWAESWATYPATNDVHASWRRIFLSPYWVWHAETNNTVDLRFRDSGGTETTLLSVSATNQTYSILDFAHDGTNGTVWVEFIPGQTNAPVIQVATNTPPTGWSNLVTTSTWPTQEWVYVDSHRYLAVQASAPMDPSNALYRVAVDGDYSGPGYVLDLAALDGVNLGLNITLADGETTISTADGNDNLTISLGGGTFNVGADNIEFDGPVDHSTHVRNSTGIYWINDDVQLAGGYVTNVTSYYVGTNGYYLATDEDDNLLWITD